MSPLATFAFNVLLQVKQSKIRFSPLRRAFPNTSFYLFAPSSYLLQLGSPNPRYRRLEIVVLTVVTKQSPSNGQPNTYIRIQLAIAGLTITDVGLTRKMAGLTTIAGDCEPRGFVQQKYW